MGWTQQKGDHWPLASWYVSPLVVVLYFLSGCLALVYEVIWIRKLSLVFGVTSLALITVLAAFFGGLALGSFLFGRLAERSRNLIRLYAYLEIAIGIYASLFPVLLHVVDQVYALLYQHISDNFPLLALSRMLLVAPLIIVPTAFMGGTLPILSRHFIGEYP